MEAIVLFLIFALIVFIGFIIMKKLDALLKEIQNE